MKYPGNELDPAEWLRAWRRFLGVAIILGALSGIGYWVDSFAHDTKTHAAIIVGVCLGSVLGFGVLSWAVVRAARVIAVPLLQLLAIAQRAEKQRDRYRDDVDSYR